MSSDMITYQCPGCRTVYSLPVQMANRWHECSKCRINNQVPARSEQDVTGDEIRERWESQPSPIVESRSPRLALTRQVSFPLDDDLTPDVQPLDSDQSWVDDSEYLVPQRPQPSSRDRLPKPTRTAPNETKLETDDAPRSRWQSVLKWAGWATGLTVAGLVAIWAYPPILLAILVGYLLVQLLLLGSAWILGFGHAWKNDKVSALFFFIPPFLYFVRYVMRNWSETRLAGMALVAFLVLTVVPFVVAIPVIALASIFHQDTVIVDGQEEGLLTGNQPLVNDPAEQGFPQPEFRSDTETARTSTSEQETELPFRESMPTDSPGDARPVDAADPSTPMAPRSAEIPPAAESQVPQPSSVTSRSVVRKNGVVTETVIESNGRVTKTVRGASNPFDPEATQRAVLLRRKLSNLKIGESIIETVIGGDQGAIWGGLDGDYSEDSDASTAAVHQGLLKVGETGRIKISVTPGISNYPQLMQNGIQSLSWGKWDSSLTFELIKAPQE